MRIFIEDSAGNRFECEVNGTTTVGTIAADFFESMNWPELDGMGRGQRAVVELVLPGIFGKKNKRLKSELTLEQSGITEESVLRIFPEPIAGGPAGLPMKAIFLKSRKGGIAVTEIPWNLTFGEIIKSVLSQFFGEEETDEKLAVISKKNRQLLPNHFTLEQGLLQENDTLIFGEEKYIFDLVSFLENLDKVPDEIFLRGHNNAIVYLRSLTQTENDPKKDGGETKSTQLNECKLVFIGNGAVGKTSLIKWLTTGTYSELEPKTEKIAIKKWSLQTKSRGKVRFNIWDFGGQEIMHSVHQMFMTTRSVYVLVANPRNDGMLGIEKELNYWLEFISNLAPSAPIIISVHKCETNVCNIGKGALKDRFPQIVGFVETSCASQIGLGELNSLIEKGIEQLSHLQDELPECFFDIKERLHKLPYDVIDYADYCKIGREVDKNFTDEYATTLSGLLHDLGVMLNYASHSYSKEFLVLNPEWITTGIYGIINSPVLINQKGVLSMDEIRAILNSVLYEKPDEQDFIVDLMCQFELCFRAKQQEKQVFYFPVAFPKDAPDNISSNELAGLHFQFHYSMLPPVIISKFIVRVRRFLKPDFYWRDGCTIENKEEGLEAIIESLTFRNIISIKITGNGYKRALLSEIRKTFQEINDDFPKITVTQMVPLDKNGSAYVSYERLLRFKEAGKTEYFDDQTMRDYQLANLLGSVIDQYQHQKDSLKNRLNRIGDKMDDLKKLLAQNDIELVFDELAKIPDLHDEAKNALVLMMSRYSSIIQDTANGVSSESESRREINQIRYGLLSLIDKT